MKNKIFIIIFLLLIVFGFGYFIGKKITYMSFADGKCKLDSNAIVCDVFVF